jgi:glycogen(starch) synthase
MGYGMSPTVSVIINTLNRGDMLKVILECMQWQNYSGKFEVIVVNGPSTDDTEKVLERWHNKVRIGNCGEANLSASRNIGISMARGDIVVFIDDDAYPEPEWLEQMVSPFRSPEVAAVGGIVYDHTGFSYQYEYRTANRLLNCNWSAKNSGEHLCYPSSFEFPYPPGGNAAYRRTALLEVGGFDEEIEYYGDETDVTIRLIDAGYLIKNIVGGYIHHKSAPSNIRNNQRVVKNWYPIIKNKIYFSVKNGRSHVSLQEILDDDKNFCETWRRDVDNKIADGLLTEQDRCEFENQQNRAWEVGLAQGLADTRKMLSQDNETNEPFLRFPTLGFSNQLSIVLISQHFPPYQEGGIPTLTKELGKALAYSGASVYVVTQSPDINRVDFEDGMWVHRVVTTASVLPDSATDQNIPQRIWDWSSTAHREVERISKHRKIAVVEAPIWDCQGIAFLLDHKWPLVTSLQTTLHFWLESHPELRQNLEWMKAFGNPMLELEKRVMSSSDGIRSISVAIKKEIENAYNFQFRDSHVIVSPLGMALPEALGLPIENISETVTLLFVGRLEHRKGIDVLLLAIPRILERHPKVRFRILGDDTLPIADGESTYKDQFISLHQGAPWLNQVSFEGRVDDKVLHTAYATCDIFVAPSRFESFGLVFLEAMREGKPVIGCSAGGMPEIICDKINGFLASPGNVDDLVEMASSLVSSRELRKKMGTAGKEIYLEKFTSQAMAKASMELFKLTQENFQEVGK